MQNDNQAYKSPVQFFNEHRFRMKRKKYRRSGPFPLLFVYVGIEIASETIVANFLFRYILRFAQPHNNKPASPASQSAHTRANSIGKWIRIIWLQVIAGCSDLMNHMNYINWSTCLWVLAHVLPHNSNAGKFQMKLKQTTDWIETLHSQYGYQSKQRNPMHLHNSMIVSTEESPFWASNAFDCNSG